MRQFVVTDLDLVKLRRVVEAALNIGTAEAMQRELRFIRSWLDHVEGTDKEAEKHAVP